MSSWRAWMARVPDQVVGARSIGARQRLFVAAVAVLPVSGGLFVIGLLLLGLMGLPQRWAIHWSSCYTDFSPRQPRQWKTGQVSGSGDRAVRSRV
ncbi:MAG TPA: hypothetical protein VHV82_13600 [Sporichthyaceae bacterium]|jgi:hypothetical protein|nr:hypothetical protein [Sporichthyaceae bacterium]